MKIIMLLQYVGQAGSAKLFVEEMFASGTVEKIRQQEGNIDYLYYQSLEDPECVLLLDSWESQEALDLHHQSPMMDEILRLREKYQLEVTAKRCTEDPEGIPSFDQTFL